jgi:hypothetical protein
MERWPTRFSMISLRPTKAPPTDKEDVGGVDLEELLLGVLAAALGGDVRGGALDDLQERLLDALAGDVAGDGGVLALAGDLVDLVDVDDAALRALDVMVGGLEEADDDVLDVFADVAGLGEVGGVDDAEGDVEEAREGLGQEGLARAGGSDEEDVALEHLDVFVGAAAGEAEVALDALIVVMNGDREDLLGLGLRDDVVVEVGLDLHGRGDALEVGVAVVAVELFLDDVPAELDALVTDIDRGAGDELLDVPLALAAERAAQVVVARAFAIG